MKLPSFNWSNEDEEGNVSAGTIQFFVVVIVFCALVYSEIMFLSIVSVAFPNNFIGGLAIVGALVTGASFLALYFGKKHWFIDKSPQFVAAVAFTAVEILIMIGNDIVAFMMQTHQDLGYLFVWKDITPASPLVAIVGWSVIAYLDPGNKIKQMKMKATQNRKELEIKHEMLLVKAHYNLQNEQTQQIVARLDDAMSAPSVQRQIEAYANRMVAKVLTQTTGINAFGGDAGDQKTVDNSAAPVSLAQTAAPTTEKLPDPS
jgi:hypothetical protein